MNRSTGNNYNYLFRYIIVGDMGKNCFIILKLSENLAFFFNLQIINLDISTS